MILITRPGGHTGQYWNNSIDYQILFFDKFFKKLNREYLTLAFQCCIFGTES